MELIVIAGHPIKNNAEGLVSLTDMYNAACSQGWADKKRNPSDWSIEAGADFIDFVAKNLNTRKQGIYKTARGKGGGTFAHWQIALAYAKYLSPELHMQVNEVYARYKAGDVTLAADIADRASPEDTLWLAKRVQGKVIRHEFTDTLRDHGVTGKGYAQCTDALNKHIVGGTAVAVRKERGLKKRETLRDSMSIHELVAMSMAEIVASNRIDRESVTGNKRCESVCDQSAASVKNLLIGAPA